MMGSPHKEQLLAPTLNLRLRGIYRLSLPIVLFVYCGFFHWSYAHWVSHIWGLEEGLTYQAPDAFLVILAYFFSVSLCLVSPFVIRRPSQIFYWFLYLTVYIPSLFVPLFVRLENTETLVLMQLSITGAMLIIALAYRLPRMKLRRYPLSTRSFWSAFFVLYCAFNATVLIVFHGSLHFSSLQEMYSIRYQQGQVLGGVAGRGHSVTAYVLIWLSNIFNPLLIAYGAWKRRWVLLVLGTFGELFLYMAASAKGVLLAPLLVILCYYSLKNDRGGWVARLSYIFAGLSSLPAAATIVNGSFVFLLGFLFLVRSTALPGLFFAQYQHFFTVFPHTYFGHVRGVSFFIPYKFQLPMGMEVSSFYHGGSSLGYEENNASFFASDGVAGLGLPGVLLMGMVCAIVFWIFDSSARALPLYFSAPATIPVGLYLANVSLFTTLISYGLALWILLFLFLPREFLGPRET